MARLRIFAAALAACMFAITASAGAEYQGTDLFGNLFALSDGGSGSPVPLPYYSLDWEVDFGLTHTGSGGAEISHFMANVFWQGAMYTANFVSGLLTFAVGLDLVSGPNGILEPISKATGELYDFVGTEWLILVILASAIWALDRIVFRRQLVTGVVALMLSILFAGVLMWLIANPQQTVGTAYRAMHEGALELFGGQEKMRRDFHRTFVHNPWLELQYGGLKVCTSATDLNENGVPRPVTTGGVCRDAGRYGRAYLRESPGSEDRKALYTAIKDGVAPWDARDRPAVDMQQEAMATERILWAFVLLVGIGFVALLMVRVAFASIFAGVALMGLFAVSPFMIVPALVPSLHHVFHRWWRMMLGALTVGLLMVIAIRLLLGFSDALSSSTGDVSVGWAFTIQTGMYILLWVYRKPMAAAVFSLGANHSRQEIRQATQYAVAAWRHPVDVTLGRSGRQQSDDVQPQGQETKMPAPPAGPPPQGPPPPAPAPFEGDLKGARKAPPQPVSHDVEPAGSRSPAPASVAAGIEQSRNGRAQALTASPNVTVCPLCYGNRGTIVDGEWTVCERCGGRGGVTR